jgi:hypothetical protein
MEFLEAPLLTGIVFYFIYLIFDLFVRKQERMNLIEKWGQNISPIDPEALSNQLSTLKPVFRKKSFNALKFGWLFVGIGFGLLVGFFISLFVYHNLSYNANGFRERELFSVAYGAPVLLFGGFGLLISYAIESKSAKKE